MRPGAASGEHEHEWVWMHDWWGAHVCECGAVQESPPTLAAPAAPSLRAALERLVREHWERQHSSWDQPCNREAMVQARAALAAAPEQPPDTTLCDCGHAAHEHTDRGEQDAGLCLHSGCHCPEFVEADLPAPAAEPTPAAEGPACPVCGDRWPHTVTNGDLEGSHDHSWPAQATGSGGLDVENLQSHVRAEAMAAVGDAVNAVFARLDAATLGGREAGE